MSGRARVTLADGRQVTGYRKTLHTRARARPLADRLHDINERCRRRRPLSGVGPDVRLGLLLPKSLTAFVSDGPHSFSTYVTKGFVQISGASAEFCFRMVDEFLADVARDAPPFRVMAVISSSERPGHFWARYVVVNARTAVVSPASEPRMYGAKAA